MLSRIALRSVQETKPCLSAFVRPTSSVVNTSNSKDAVTFERRKRPIHPGKVRMGFVPEEWFQFFYTKTGVTGPYVFGASFLTYLMSKEILVLEHEAFAGLSLAILGVFAVKKLGPGIAAALDKNIEEYEADYNNYRDEKVNSIQTNIEGEKRYQFEAMGQSMLYDAKKENIGLQLESAYRERLSHVHSMVKKKLDYQLETFNVKTRLEQRHMVNWIVDTVRKSITPAQEAAALKQCLGDLKALSVAKA